MKYLKSERAWKRWAARINRWQPQAPIEPPTQYPCFGYLMTTSFNYEEEAAYYLYVRDVEKMLRQMGNWRVPFTRA
ncbi:MAG TPA: hypothetical protein VF614_15695 [Chthoniobacteraceae bacterium]